MFVITNQTVYVTKGCWIWKIILLHALKKQWLRFSIKLINGNDELQWCLCICIDVIRVIVVKSSLFVINVVDVIRYNVI